MALPDLVLMGRAAGAFGVKGEVKLTSFAQDDSIFKRVELIYAGSEPGAAKPLTILGARRHSGRLLLRLKEIATREQAAALGGAWVYLRVEDLDPLGEDEYYWFQLKGAQVLTAGGRLLGRVKAVTDAGAQELLVVSAPQKPELLVPVVDDIVKEIAPEQGRVVIDPPPGLLECQGWEEEE
ncbi:MAG: ribosome maturation factor RimM [Deltaproteobacteria bacterium]|nr:ribosome maturation factor RimM [Deltaproteobacteria bacterium]